jgi:predicted small secreted protein
LNKPVSDIDTSRRRCRGTASRDASSTCGHAAQGGEVKMKAILMVLALASGLIVSACNTVEGAGKDIKSVGECADGRPGNC